MSVFESGFPPLGGSAAPPKTLVNLPHEGAFTSHPESAARSNNNSPVCSAEQVITALLARLACFLSLLLL
ncbi:hypothetical protein D5086_001211 [Populus alba]|uniref:Uncharacterized protein n=1 Tax=Populus alba TaxID=43335 RepID=A0ACC4D087_POPAL